MARSMIDLETIIEPYKASKLGTLASRARSIGLESITIDFIHYGKVCDFAFAVNRETESKCELMFVCC